MRPSTGGRHVSESTWLKLSSNTLNGMMIAAMAATAVSLLFISSGMHEASMTSIVLAMGVIALGFILFKSFDYLRAEGIPVIE